MDWRPALMIGGVGPYIVACEMCGPNGLAWIARWAKRDRIPGAHVPDKPGDGESAGE